MFTGHCRKSSQDCASTSANSRQSNAQHGYLLGRNPHCGYDPRTIVPLTGIAATCCKSLKLLHATWKRHQRPPQRTITYIVIQWLSDPDQGSTVSSVCQFGGMTCVFYRKKTRLSTIRYATYFAFSRGWCSKSAALTIRRETSTGWWPATVTHDSD